MTSVGELGERIRQALSLVARTRSLLMQADQDLADAGDVWGEVTYGTSDPEAAVLPAMAEDARGAVIGLVGTLGALSELLHRYLDALGVGGSEPGLSPTASPRVASWTGASYRDVSEVRYPSRKRVEELRGELPPPVQRRGGGAKTHGRWLGQDGSVHQLLSGRDELTVQVNAVLKELGCETVPVSTSADVELKLATLMRDRGPSDSTMRHVTLVINNDPCKGRLSCDELVPVILPEGYSLTVHGMGVRKRYTGGAVPKWK